MALGGLRRWGEDRLGKAVRLAQTGRQRDAADVALGAVLLEARSGEVAARHALDGDDLGAPHEHRAACERRLVAERAGEVPSIRREHVVADEAPASPSSQKSVSPVSTRPLSGIGFGQDHVERADAIGGDEQESLVIDLVDVADLALRSQPATHASSLTISRSSRSNTTSRFRWNRAGSNSSVSSSGRDERLHARVGRDRLAERDTGVPRRSRSALHDLIRVVTREPGVDERE